MAGLVFVLAAIVPYRTSLGNLDNLVNLFVLVILATTWNLLAGYGGMVSIGQQAFIGLGGYGVIYLSDNIGLPVLLALPLAGVLAAAFAYPTSFLAFRLSGGYFAIGTWVIAEVYMLVTGQIGALGGGSGLSLMAFRGVDKVSRIGLVYWSAMTVTVFTVLAAYLLMRSHVGLGLTAIRDDVTAAGTLGVDVTQSKRLVYVAASAGAGLAGALIALSSLRVEPDSNYSVNYTAFMVFMVVIGGLGTIEGPILGAVVFFVLQNQLSELGSWYLIILGVVAISVALIAPKGVWGLISSRGRVQLFPVGFRVKTRLDDPRAQPAGRPTT